MTAYVDASVILRLALGQRNGLTEWPKIQRGVSSALITTESLRTLDRLRLRAKLSDVEVATRRAAILSLIATIGAGVAFLLMLQESIALTRGTDPLSNGVRSFVRRFPRFTYALAVLIGMLLGHLLWP